MSRLAIGGAIAAAALAASGGAQAAGHRAEIVRTQYGIPHITAKDYGGLGFGEAYAYLEDNLCLIADKIVTVNGERSRWFGADGTTTVAFAETRNIDADIFFKASLDRGVLRKAFAAVSPDYRALLEGYAAGYNRFLKDHPAQTRPQGCREAWVRPISVDDLLLLNEERMIQASGGAWLRQTLAAEPPASRTASLEPVGLPAEPEGVGLGSNGWAFGRSVTANGSGVLLGNPHFPWETTNRFWEVHLRIPGKLDTMGVSIAGAPGISIGFNHDVAWTHTVSTDRHFTLFELALDPKDPTAYLVDGRSEPMTRRTISVQVKGEAKPRTRTLFATRYGPVVAMPQVGMTWSAKTAYAFKDANRGNLRSGDAWLGIAQARNVGEIRAGITKTLGIPWVNTIAADRNGDILYADVTATPNVSDAKLKACAPPSGVGAMAASARLYVLDGARSACDWDVAPGTVQAGLLPGETMPAQVRTDWVANSNDSYWLANASAPMPAQPAIVGPVNTPQNLRTRSGVLEITNRLAGADDLPGRSIDPKAVEAMLYRNRNLAAELSLDGVARICAGAGPVTVASGRTIHVTRACEVLAGWNRRMDVDSVGAHLFVEFWKSAERIPNFWAAPFDPADPVHTPRGVSSDPAVAAKVLQALAQAVDTLEQAHIPLDRPWGQVQVALRGDARIPVHGGEGGDGVLNAQQSKLVPGVGYVPYHGSSYIQVVTFDPQGPAADAILTYSQSTDPASPHFGDQTRLHAAKTWVKLPYHQADIDADPTATRKTVHD